jgi:arylsulfatase A-like enzyme
MMADPTCGHGRARPDGRPLLRAALACSLLALAVSAQSGSRRPYPAPEEPPDIVLVVIDDVGWADLAAVAARGHAPNITALGQRGFRFTNLRSAPTCSPTRRMLYFGDFSAARNGEVCAPASGEEPPTTAVSVAELASVQGYATALIGKWHVGSNPIGPWPEVVLARGFDHWRAGLPTNVKGCGGNAYDRWRRVHDATDLGIDQTDQPTAMWDEFSALWDATAEPRFFVFASQLAHGPFRRPVILPASYPPTVTRRERYESMIAAADLQVGQIASRMNLAKDVLVVLCDNGTPPQVAPVGLEERVKTTSFEGGVHVPGFIVGAGIPPGQTAALVSVADFYATVADLAGAVSPAGLDSRSLLPLVDGTARKVHDYIAYGSGDETTDDYAVSSLRYKYRRWRTRATDGSTGPWVEEFYDLLTDPGEWINLVTDPTMAVKVAAHAAFMDAELP